MVEQTSFKVVIPFKSQVETFLNICEQKGFAFVDEDITTDDMLFFIYINRLQIDCEIDINYFREDKLKQISFSKAKKIINHLPDKSVNFTIKKGDLVLCRKYDNIYWYVGVFNKLTNDGFKVNDIIYQHIVEFEKNKQYINTISNIKHYYFDNNNNLQFG